MNRLKGCVVLGALFCLPCHAQEHNKVATVAASAQAETVSRAFDGDMETAWSLPAKELAAGQWLSFSLQQPGDVKELTICVDNWSKEAVKNRLALFVTYDPMNPGDPVGYTIKEKNNCYTLSFAPKYGAHVKLVLKGDAGGSSAVLSIKEIGVALAQSDTKAKNGIQFDKPYMNPELPLEERVESLLAVMTPEDKMELIREGWGIPGIAHLGIPSIMKVEAIHGFSYGSGATIFPQAIGMGAGEEKQIRFDISNPACKQLQFVTRYKSVGLDLTSSLPAD